MTVIFEDAHISIEVFSETITVENAAGIVTGANHPLRNAGFFLFGGASKTNTTQNDNTAAIGNFTLLDNASGGISVDEFLTGFRVRIDKQLGTDGSTNILVHSFCCVAKRRRN